jgi:hypothetical protein
MAKRLKVSEVALELASGKNLGATAEHLSRDGMSRGKKKRGDGRAQETGTIRKAMHALYLRPRSVRSKPHTSEAFRASRKSSTVT